MITLPSRDTAVMFKADYPDLPARMGAERIVWFMGWAPGSAAQYRGPNGLHISEYQDFWKVHYDTYDPRFSPVEHLLFDTQMVPLALSALGLAVALYAAVMVTTREGK